MVAVLAVLKDSFSGLEGGVGGGTPRLVSDFKFRRATNDHITAETGQKGLVVRTRASVAPSR